MRPLSRYRRPEQFTVFNEVCSGGAITAHRQVRAAQRSFILAVLHTASLSGSSLTNTCSTAHTGKFCVFREAKISPFRQKAKLCPSSSCLPLIHLQYRTRRQILRFSQSENSAFQAKSKTLPKFERFIARIYSLSPTPPSNTSEQLDQSQFFLVYAEYGRQSHCPHLSEPLPRHFCISLQAKSRYRD